MSKDYIAKAKHLARKIKDDKAETIKTNIKETKVFVAATTRMRNKVKTALQPFNKLKLGRGKLHIVSKDIWSVDLIQRINGEDDVERLSLEIHPDKIVFPYRTHWDYETYTSIDKLLDFIAEFVSKHL